MAGGNFGGGSGTTGLPYLIEDAQDVNAIRNFATFHFRLKNNIDMSYYANFVPIPLFTGSLDGDGYEINNLKISSTASYAGLFSSFLSFDVSIKNLILNKPYVHSTSGMVGSLVGYARSATLTLSDISVIDCDVSGLARVGGLVGFADGANSATKLNAERCSVTGTVTCVNDNVGGFIGNTQDQRSDVLFSFKYCYANCIVRGTSYVGGFVGQDTFTASSFFQCYGAGEVSGYDYVGGFTGGAAGTGMSYCLSLVDKVSIRYASPTNFNAGDFAGANNNSTTCYAIDTISFTAGA